MPVSYTHLDVYKRQVLCLAVLGVAVKRISMAALHREYSEKENTYVQEFFNGTEMCIRDSLQSCYDSFAYAGIRKGDFEFFLFL